MKKSILLLLVFATVLCFSASADTYTWALQQGWAWDTNIVWNPADVANSNKYPNARDDVAIVNTLITNSSGNYQIWPNQFGHIYTTIGEWWLNMTNELIFGAGDASSFNAMVFQTTNEQAKLIYNNLFIDESDPYWWWNHILNLRFATSYILSNDLILFAEGPVDSYGDKDSAVIWLVDDGQVFGDQALIKEGEGRFIIGAHYSDTHEYSNPQFHLTKPIYVNNGTIEPNHGTTFSSPIVLGAGTNYSGFYRQYSEDGVDVDLVFNGGFYVANYSGTGAPMAPTNNAKITVCQQADLLVFPGHNAYFGGTVEGTNWVAEWNGGDVLFGGTVSPGIGAGSMAQLSFYSSNTNSIRIGSPDDPADLNIDINGANSDILVVQGLFALSLTNINLKLNISNPDPNATNLIVYSFDGSDANVGVFKSVEWTPTNYTGTIIYYPNAVEITGIEEIPEPAIFTVIGMFVLAFIGLKFKK